MPFHLLGPKGVYDIVTICVLSCLGDGAVKMWLGAITVVGNKRKQRSMLFSPQMAARHPYSSGASTEERGSQCYLSSPVPSPPLSIYFFSILKIKRGNENTPFSLFFFLHPSAFHLTKIHIYANTRHLFPPLPHTGDGSQARINDIASAVMFGAFH